MSLAEKVRSFNKRWNVPGEAPEIALAKFKARVLNVFSGIDSDLDEESVEKFCNVLGRRAVWNYDQFNYRNYGTNIIDALRSETDLRKILLMIEIVFSLPIRATIGYRGVTVRDKSSYLKKCLEILEHSDIGLEFASNEKTHEIIFYPAGEKILDEELVNEALSFVDKKSQKHFVDALEFYQQNNPVKSAESLRRTAEEFLRHKLGNQAGLAANIQELSRELKKERDVQLRNIVFSIFSYLDQYFNENSKHNDGDIDAAENEFLIYQTATLLRFVNRAAASGKGGDSS